MQADRRHRDDERRSSVGAGGAHAEAALAVDAVGGSPRIESDQIDVEGVAERAAAGAGSLALVTRTTLALVDGARLGYVTRGGAEGGRGGEAEGG